MSGGEKWIPEWARGLTAGVVLGVPLLAWGFWSAIWAGFVFFAGVMLGTAEEAWGRRKGGEWPP